MGASGEEGDLRLASGGDVLPDRPVDALRLVLATNRQRSGNRLRERKVVVGGLGHIAVQILKALTPARILACDSTRHTRAFARNRSMGSPWSVRMADRRRRQRATLGGTRTNEEEEVTWLDSRKRLRW